MIPHMHHNVFAVQAWELIQTVPPFHATTFQSGLSSNPTRAGLDILQGCAHRLLYELKMEGLATGLDVFVEVLLSSYRAGTWSSILRIETRRRHGLPDSIRTSRQPRAGMLS